MVRAVIAAEDQKFVHHFGFDVDSISKAYVNNRDGGRRKGGSTITQQTAKNIFLWPGGSYLRKGIEAYFTLLLELFWNKERIIEVYLNIAELGPGVYGVESAARIYYHTSARRLTARQAAMACRDPAGTPANGAPPARPVTWSTDSAGSCSRCAIWVRSHSTDPPRDPRQAVDLDDDRHWALLLER